MPSRAKKAKVSEDTSMEDVPTSAQTNDETQETGDGMDEDGAEEGGADDEEQVVQRVRIVGLPQFLAADRAVS